MNAPGERLILELLLHRGNFNFSDLPRWLYIRACGQKTAKFIHGEQGLREGRLASHSQVGSMAGNGFDHLLGPSGIPKNCHSLGWMIGRVRPALIIKIMKKAGVSPQFGIPAFL